MTSPKDPTQEDIALSNEKLHRGEGCFRRGEGEAALAEFMSAIELNPDNGRAHHYLGSLYWNSGDGNRAIQHLKTAHHMNSDDITLTRSLGIAQELTGDLAAARETYQAFLKGNPDNIEIAALLKLNRELSTPATEAAKDNNDAPILDTLKLENFSPYTYSKRDHFSSLQMPYFHKDKQAQYCDLKVYQDMLAFNFLLSNLPRGAKILEIGGGDSRVISALHNFYECWNLDKFEGAGNGPLGSHDIPGTRVVIDYIGAFNKQLPDNYFDCVYSISTLEHVPEDQGTFKDITADIERVLCPGGLSMQCFDIVITPDGMWTNGLLKYFYGHENIIGQEMDFDKIIADPDTHILSEEYFDAHWKPFCEGDYKDSGRALSYNILWQK